MTDNPGYAEGTRSLSQETEPISGVQIACRLEAGLGKRHWGKWHPRPFGPDGVALVGPEGYTVIVTRADHDGVEWLHASIANAHSLPSYRQLCVLKEAVFGSDRYAFQVFPPSSEHVNIHENALHLWGREDGTSPLPEFGKWGTI